MTESVTWISLTEHDEQDQCDISQVQQYQPEAGEVVQEGREQHEDVDSCPQEELNDPVKPEQLHQQQDQEVFNWSFYATCMHTFYQTTYGDVHTSVSVHIITQ